ncbi:MAG: hypothetical protein JXB03_04925 [Spirochaetales bacterium]|nr:hypothetical protein [Spirochaetales bacterium]
MVQIYLLSVVAGVLGGALLLADQLSEKVPSLMAFREWYRRNTAYHPFIFFTFTVIGVLTLVFPYHGLPVLGDFIPSLANLLVGFVLFLEYYQEKGRVVSESFTKIISVSEQYQSAFGAIAVISSIAHFIFPGVIFL